MAADYYRSDQCGASLSQLYYVESRLIFHRGLRVIANRIGRPRMAYRVLAVCREYRESVALFRGRERDFITRQNGNNFLLRDVAWRGAARCIHINTFSDDKWIPRSVRWPLLPCSATREREKRPCTVTLADNLWHFCHLGYRSGDKKDFIISTGRLIWAVGIGEPVYRDRTEQMSD